MHLSSIALSETFANVALATHVGSRKQPGIESLLSLEAQETRRNRRALVSNSFLTAQQPISNSAVPLDSQKTKKKTVLTELNHHPSPSDGLLKNGPTTLQVECDPHSSEPDIHHGTG